MKMLKVFSYASGVRKVTRRFFSQFEVTKVDYDYLLNKKHEFEKKIKALLVVTKKLVKASK